MISIFKITVWLLVILHIAKPFVRGDITVLIGVCAVIAAISGLPLMGKSYRKATLAFLISGSAALLYLREPIAVWLGAAGTLSNVIAILVMMQIFSIPIQVGQYNAAIRYWLARCFKNQAGLFLFTMAATHVLTSFLMFGAIPVMVSLMGQTIKGQVREFERFMASAMSRGYALASLWAPGAINLFLVVQATGVNWSSVFVPGIALSAIGLGVSYFLERKRFISIEGCQADSVLQAAAGNNGLERRKVLHILAVVFGLILLTLSLDALHIGNSSNRIIVAGLIVSCSWITAFIGQPVLKAALRNYWKNGVVKAGDLVPFFIAMGIFSTALEQSGLLEFARVHIQAAASWAGIYSIVFIPLLVIGAAVLAIHPFITIVMFGKILTVLHLPVSMTTIALCLALGGSISYMVSPFAGVIMTIAKLVDAKAQDVAITWNRTYCLIYFVIGIVFAYLWGLWI